MIVRSVRLAEHAEVGDLTVAAYRADGYLLGTEDFYEERLRDVSGRVADAEVLVAVADDRIVGTVTYCPHGSAWSELAVPGEGEFRMLAVPPDGRGLGVGATLVEHCLQRSLLDGHSGVVICSLPEMHSAHRLYGRLGFRRDPALDWEPVPGVALIAFRRNHTPAGA
ncbi:MAG: GNAT family N-acetyltransferase [Nocardioides sp.]